MQQPQLHNVKSSLAKLLATENITIQHQSSANTASFDIKNRILTLPVWKDISENLYDMLVVHEVGHALDTPCDDWIASIKKVAQNNHDQPTKINEAHIKDYFNIVEDARIDKRQKRRFPGSKRNYVHGQKELLDRNFYGIVGKELSTLSLIDRINLHYKTSTLIVPFSAEEKPFVKRIDNVETWEQVEEIVNEIYAYSLKQQEEQNEKEEQQPEQDDDYDSLDSVNDDDFDLDSSDDFEDSDDQDSEAGNSDETEDSDEEINDSIDNNNGSDDSDDSDDHDKLVESITEQASRKAMESIIQSDDINYIYCHLPKFKLENIVDDFSVVIPQMTTSFNKTYHDPIYHALYQSKVLKEFHDWKRKETDTISFMVKEFEMKKAADLHSRVSISKTGVIDTNKLHSYKYNEDIFRKLAILPQGKNHGFVMLLDWSGSMRPALKHTIKQLFSLTMFCKRVQIPFEVYLFRNASYEEEVKSRDNGGQYDLEHGVVQFHSFRLRNILSSRMNLATLNKAYELLWYSTENMLSCDQMDSTPLNQAIVALDEIVNGFQRKNKLQIVSTIILTDGASDPAGYVYHDPKIPSLPNKTKGNRYILKDEKTKHTYDFSRGYGSDSTNIFLKVLKERTGCNLIGFYLNDNSLKSLSYLVDYTWLSKPEVMKQWREDKFITLVNGGYDEYYVLNFNRKHLANEVDNSLKIDSTMTKSKIAKEFARFNEKKTVNRVLLSKFITRVSATHGIAA